MLVDEEKKELPAPVDDSLSEKVDTALVSVPLDKEEKVIVEKIIEADTKEQLVAQFDLFNINQSKKNALRVIKLNTLLDKVEDQAIARMTKRPDMISNRELLDYMNVVSNQIDRANKQINTLKDTPAISLKQENKTQVNITVGQVDHEGKEKVIDAISALIKQLNSAPQEPSSDIIDAETVEESEEEDVYLKDDAEIK